MGGTIDKAINTLNNFIEGDIKLNNLERIFNLLLGAETNITKNGVFNFQYKEFSYELFIESIRIETKNCLPTRIIVSGLKLNFQIESNSKEPNELIVKVDNKNNIENETKKEQTLVNKLLEYLFKILYIPEIIITDINISIKIKNDIHKHLIPTPMILILVDCISLLNSDQSGKKFNKILEIKDFKVLLKDPFYKKSENYVDYFNYENILAITNDFKGNIVNECTIIKIYIEDMNDYLFIKIPLESFEIILDQLQLQYLLVIFDVMGYIDKKFIKNSNNVNISSNIENNNFIPKQLSNIRLNFSIKLFNLILFEDNLPRNTTNYKYWLGKKPILIRNTEEIKQHFCIYKENYYLFKILDIDFSFNKLSNEDSIKLKFDNVYFSYICSIVENQISIYESVLELEEEERMKENSLEEKIINIFNEYQKNYLLKFFSYDILIIEDQICISITNTNEKINHDKKVIKKTKISLNIKSSVDFIFHNILLYLMKTISNNNYVIIKYMINDFINDKDALININYNFNDLINNDSVPNIDQKFKIENRIEFELDIKQINLKYKKFPYFNKFLNQFYLNNIQFLQHQLSGKSNFGISEYFSDDDSLDIIFVGNKMNLIDENIAGNKNFMFNILINDIFLNQKINNGNSKDYDLNEKSNLMEIKNLCISNDKLLMNKLIMNAEKIDINLNLQNTLNLINFIDNFLYTFNFQDIFKSLSYYNPLLKTIYSNLTGLPSPTIYKFTAQNDEKIKFQVFFRVESTVINILRNEKEVLYKCLLYDLETDFLMKCNLKKTDIKLMNLFIIYLNREENDKDKDKFLLKNLHKNVENEENFHYTIYQSSKQQDSTFLELSLIIKEKDNPEENSFDYDNCFVATRVKDIDYEKYGFYLNEKLVFDDLDSFVIKNIIKLKDNHFSIKCTIDNMYLSPFQLYNDLNVVKEILKIFKNLENNDQKFEFCTINNKVFEEMDISFKTLSIDFFDIESKNKKSALENKFIINKFRMRFILIIEDIELNLKDEKQNILNINLPMIRCYFLKNLCYLNVLGKLDKDFEFANHGFLEIICLSLIVFVFKNTIEVQEETYKLIIKEAKINLGQDSFKYLIKFIKSFENLTEISNDNYELNPKIINIEDESQGQIIINSSIKYSFDIEILQIYLNEMDDFNFTDKNLKIKEENELKINIIDSGDFKFSNPKNVNLIKNYYDYLYMKNHKERKRIKKDKPNYIKILLKGLSTILEKKNSFDIFNLKLLEFTIYENNNPLIDIWSKKKKEDFNELLRIDFQAFNTINSVDVKILEIKINPLDIRIDISSIFFISLFFDFSEYQNNPEQIYKIGQQMEEKPQPTKKNLQFQYILIDDILLKLNIENERKTFEVLNKYVNLLPSFIAVRDLDVPLEKYIYEKETISLDKFLLNAKTHYSKKFSRFDSLSKFLSSIRFFRPITDFIDGFINLIRLPLKFYVKGDGVFKGFAFGLSNFFHKITRGSYQFCKNMIYPIFGRISTDSD